MFMIKEHKNMNSTTHHRLIGLILMILVAGCAPTQDSLEGARKARTSSAAANDPNERLRDELAEFMVFLDRSLTRVEAQVARSNVDDPEFLNKLFNSRNQIEMNFAYSYSQPNSFVAMIELWYDAYRFNAWRQEAPGEAKLFMYGNVTQRVLDRIRNIARRWIEPGQFEQLDKRVRARANQDEEVTSFADLNMAVTQKHPALVDRNESNGIIGVLGLPLAPFTASESISRSAVELGMEARRIADRIDRLPIDIGSEIELITLEILASPQITSLLQQVQEITGEIAKVVVEIQKTESIMERTPTRIREEAELFMASIEEQSESLIDLTRAAQETFESADVTLNSLDQATQSLTTLAQQAEETSQTLDGIFGFSNPGEGEPAASNDELLEQLTILGAEIRNAADALTESIRAAEELATSPDLDTVVTRLDQSVQSGVDQANQTIAKASNRIAWIGSLLLVLAFLLGGGLVFLSARLRRKTG